MRWGIHTIEDYHEETHGSLPEFYDKLVARAVLAEELGYESFWLTEHHFHWLGGAHANPLVALSAIAARTRKLRLGTAVTLLPYRHPLLVAEEIACLDNLSHGRVDVGIGRGFFIDHGVSSSAVSSLSEACQASALPLRAARAGFGEMS